MSINPFLQFEQWFEAAQTCSSISDATAMCLATASKDGYPSNRMVLLKSFDEKGFVFYTNLLSKKGGQLHENPQAALCFYWAPLDRQIRIEGTIESVSSEEADKYFASRPRDSKIGAWASKQSQKIQSSGDLVGRIAKFSAKFGLGDIPRPPHWSGFRLVPQFIEFWSNGAFRIHDREVFTLEGEGAWRVDKLYP